MTLLPLFVTLKKVYDRNVVNKYRLYLILGVMIFSIIDYIYIYIYIYIYKALNETAKGKLKTLLTLPIEFYWIKVFLKLPFTVSFSVLFITIRYAAFRRSLRTFYTSLCIYIYIHIHLPIYI